MSDFYESIRAGISSARSADSAAREVGEIFDKLDRDVMAATGGKVRVKIEATPIRNALAAFARSQNFTKPMAALSLVSVSDTTKKSELAMIYQESAGYPVQIASGNASMTSKDAAGLTAALSNIMAKAETGRALIQLSSILPQIDATTAPQKKTTNALMKSSPPRTRKK